VNPQPDNLPAWAAWLAQDADGAWWCYEAEPNQHDTGWYENEVGRIAKIGQDAPNPAWRDALVRVARDPAPWKR
jgi:hypothetical protein